MEASSSQPAAESNGNGMLNGDSAQFVQSLSELRLHDRELDESGTADLVERCLTQFNNTAASSDSRGIALYTLMAQLQHDNPCITKHVQRIKESVCQPQVFNHPTTTDNDDTFHREVLGAVSIIHCFHPECLVAHDFPKTLRYVISSLTNKRAGISFAACDFWVRLGDPPVPQSLVKQWNAVVVAEIPEIFQSLMSLMTYRPEHAAYLEEHASSCTDPMKQTMPAELETVASIRNYAALALEHMCRTCPIDAVCDAVRPIFEKDIDDEDWMKKEVTVLALAAFTEGAGVPDNMRESYPIIIPRVLDCYTHPRPLVRSMACFTMPKLLGYRLRGVKDPLSRVLSCTAKCLRDYCPEVRSMASRGLAAILAYVGGDIASHTPRLVDALVRSSTYQMDADTRCAHYECVTHLVCRVASVLSPSDFEQLTLPMIDRWCKLQWKPTDSSNDEANEETDGVIEPELGVVPLAQSLCAIANYAKSLFAPYAERIFNKTSTDISDILLYIKTHCQDQGDIALPVAITTHLLASFDVLSALYDGLESDVAVYAAKNRVLAFIHTVLTTETFNDMVHQRAFILLGHVIAHDTKSTDPPVSDFIDISIAKVDMESSSEKLRGSALWALASIAHHRCADISKLFTLIDRLIKIFECVDGSPPCIINAAWALTNICAAHSSQSIAVVTRSDVFLHLCGLLQAPFPRSLEKLCIFKNVCLMLTPAVSKVDGELWPAFLAAVAISDDTVAKDEELQTGLRSLLRDIKATLGVTGWTKLQQDIGNHMASVIRRRFKLY